MESLVTIKGQYRISRYKSLPLPKERKLELLRAGELDVALLEVSPVIHNTVPTATNHGLNIIAQRLAGTTTYDIQITQAKIGTGQTAPAVTDTDLVSASVSGILVADQAYSGTTATITFFITDAELANGTYYEFGIFAGSQLFGRSLISPAYTKATNEDTRIDYTLTFANV